MIREAIGFLGKSPAKRCSRFFAVVWFGSPHEPYSGLKKDLALYDNLPSAILRQTGEADIQQNRPSDKTAASRCAQGTLRRDYGDGSFDRTASPVVEKGKLRDNTLLWYCGDNGTPGDGIVTSPFRGQKGNMYEGGIRVPGIIEWPSRIIESKHL